MEGSSAEAALTPGVPAKKTEGADGIPEARFLPELLKIMRKGL